MVWKRQGFFLETEEPTYNGRHAQLAVVGKMPCPMVLFPRGLIRMEHAKVRERDQVKIKERDQGKGSGVSIQGW